MTPYRFSANTGFLWTDLPFLERIRMASKHGFDAVEFHDEAQHTDRAALKSVLSETGIPVVGLNVRIGETAGCAAIPEMVELVRADILDALELAQDIGAGAVHVLSGITSAESARDTYIAALQFALTHSDLTILIEPICTLAIPGYFLDSIEKPAGIVTDIDHPRLKIMFDCYHIEGMSGDVAETFTRHAGQIGHVQISSFPDRSEPVPGTLDYRTLLPGFIKAGYNGAFGCEYRPRGAMEDGLGWRAQFLSDT